MFKILKNNYRGLLIVGGLSFFLVAAAALMFYKSGIFIKENQQNACLKNLENISAEELYKRIPNLKDFSVQNSKIIVDGLKNNLSCVLRQWPSVKDLNLFISFVENSSLSRDEINLLISELNKDYKEGLEIPFSTLVAFGDIEDLCSGGKENPLLIKKCVEMSLQPRTYDGRLITYDLEDASVVCNNFCGPILKYQNNPPSVFMTELRFFLDKKKRLRRDAFEDTFWLLLLFRYGDENLKKEFCNHYDLSEQPACLDSIRIFRSSSDIINSPELRERKCRLIFDRVKVDICQYFPDI